MLRLQDNFAWKDFDLPETVPSKGEADAVTNLSNGRTLSQSGEGKQKVE